jgi:hypothetical protein
MNKEKKANAWSGKYLNSKRKQNINLLAYAHHG